MIDFAKSVKKLMLDKNIKQFELGERLGMSAALISAYLKRKDFRINADIARIADALNCDVVLTLIDRETGQRIDCK